MKFNLFRFISEKFQKDLKEEFRPQFWSNVQHSEVSLNNMSYVLT